MDEFKTKWDYVSAISRLSSGRGDIYGVNGLLKLLEETGKINTQQLTLEEVREFWFAMKND